MDPRLFVLALGMFALGTDSFVVAGVLPQIAHSFDVSIGAAGQLVAVYAVTLAILAPTVAALASDVRPKRLLLAGLLVFVVANLATAVAPTFGVALATRALAGLGAAMFSPTAMSAATMMVPSDRRGVALSVVAAGMTVSTALGAPTGAVIGGLATWHWTMIFVAALAAASTLGIWTYLPEIPRPPAVALRDRLAPIKDARIGLTLATTLLFLSGAFAIYTYTTVVFARAIGGNAVLLGGLLVLWGASGTVSNLLAGRLVDRIGPRKVLVGMMVVLVVDFLTLPWTRDGLWTAVPVIALWGACGWGQAVPQIYRLISIAPAAAPVLLGLNNTAAYLGMTAGSIVGAAALRGVGVGGLGFVAAGLVGAALLVAELASYKIAAAQKPQAQEVRPASEAV